MSKKAGVILAGIVILLAMAYGYCLVRWLNPEYSWALNRSIAYVYGHDYLTVSTRKLVSFVDSDTSTAFLQPMPWTKAIDSLFIVLLVLLTLRVIRSGNGRWALGALYGILIAAAILLLAQERSRVDEALHRKPGPSAFLPIDTSYITGPLIANSVVPKLILMLLSAMALACLAASKKSQLALQYPESVA